MCLVCILYVLLEKRHPLKRYDRDITFDLDRNMGNAFEMIDLR